ncbi:hypothetical protein ES708_24045 [subsurface metagenome]
MHDTILFYTKSKKWTFNKLELPVQEYLQVRKEKGWNSNTIQTAKGRIRQLLVYDKTIFKEAVKSGRVRPKDWDKIVYAEQRTIPASDVFEIPFINPVAKERVGYPTQKPEALLERIIKASSNEDDLVLDPFCGCGTTIASAEKLRRRWTGIDVTYLAIDVIKKRMEKNYIKENEHFKVYGDPKDVYSAGKLAEQKPFQFEVWAVSQLNATPTAKTGDKGVDGVINFVDNTKKEKIGRGIISVKGGYSINPGMVRDLKGTIQSQNADFGILITLKRPTRGMIEEAVKGGSFDYCYHEGTTHKKIPKIQLLTVEDLFTDPIPVKLPPTVIEPYRKNDIKKDNRQQTLLI